MVQYGSIALIYHNYDVGVLSFFMKVEMFEILFITNEIVAIDSICSRFAQPIFYLSSFCLLKDYFKQLFHRCVILISLADA